MTGYNANLPLRRLTTGIAVTAPTNIAKGATLSVPITFDLPLPDTNYIVVAHAYDQDSQVFLHVGTASKAVDGCTVTVQNIGSKTAAAVTVEVIAARRVLG